MSGLIDNYVLPAVISNSGARIQKIVARFSENYQLACPCGTTIYLATDELIAIIDQLGVAIGLLNRPSPEGRAR